MKKLLEISVFFVYIPCMLIADGIIAWHYRHHFFAQQPTPPAVVKTVPRISTENRNQAHAYQAKLLFMGDTMLARTIGQSIVSGNNPFKYVQSTLDTYDFRMANVETTIADPSVTARAIGKLYTFNAPVQSVGTLKNARVDVAGLANNHTKDFGSPALSNMIDNLLAAGIKVVGAGKNIDQAFAPLLVDVPAPAADSSKSTGTLRLGIIAANDIENNYTVATSTAAGSAFFDETRIAAAIKTARETDKADIVIVVPHWGVEYQTSPSDRQIAWGHFFIDSGADMVIGSHPHVVQAAETYKGKNIVYSMGNFIFDGMGGNALDGEMVGVTVDIKTSATRSAAIEPPSLIATRIDAAGYPELK